MFGGIKVVEKLKKGEIENKEFMRCNQIQCSYFTMGHCQNCDDCGTTSYEIRKSCKRCWDCMTIPDNLRWGDRNIDNKEDIKVSRKRMIIMAGGIPIGMVEEIEPQQRKPKEEKEMVM